MSTDVKTIGERKYSFGTIPATTAIKVEVAIARVIGEPLFKAFTSVGKMDDKKAMKEAGMAAIGLMAARMDADELLVTMKTVFGFVTFDGKRIDIDQHFTGRNKELWEVFVAALQHNFSDFLPDSLFDSTDEVATDE